MGDYISDQLRAKAAALRGTTSTPTFGQLIAAANQAKAVGALHAQREARATRDARKAAAEQAQATALAEWQDLWARIPETPEGQVLRKLLDLHKPYLSSSYGTPPACEDCDQIGGWERDGVPWPCVNYEIIKEGMG